MTEIPLNIILIGKTGSGKSSTGNFIVGNQLFKSTGGFKSTTKEIHLEKTVQDGRTIKVVDTPGLFDTDENLFETALKIQTSLKEISPGPHAFLIVIDASHKYTEEEQMTQHIIQLTFGVNIFKHALIVFTHEDSFDSSEDLVKEAQSVKELHTLIELCSGRCITLNSRNKDIHYRTGKLKNILKKVTDISKDGIECYTEKRLEIYTKALQEEAKKKTATKDLKLEMIANIIRETEKREKEAEERAKEAEKRAERAEERAKSSDSEGSAMVFLAGTIAGGLTVAVTGVGLACYAIHSVANMSPEKKEKIKIYGLALGNKLLEMKHKRDNEASYPFYRHELEMRESLERFPFNIK